MKTAVASGGIHTTAHPGSLQVRHLALANIGVSVAAFGVASGMALMQALSRANLDLPFRTAQMYVDVSARADNCATCTFFTAGAAGACGTCTLVHGPISPAGYCNLFSRRPT